MGYCLARFGFFDLEATFSAALTLVMMGFIDNVRSSDMPPELKQAVEVLQYLSLAGNRAAEQRLRDIEQFSSHVWPGQSMETPRSRSMSSGATPRSLARDTREGRGDDLYEDLHDQEGERQPSQAAPNIQQNDTTTEQQQEHMSPLIDFNKGCDFGTDLNLEADGIYSSFNDPSLPLTGVDQLDWAEMEKIFRST